MSYSKCERRRLSICMRSCLESVRVRGVSKYAWNITCLEVRMGFGRGSCPSVVRGESGM
jgi:hypothetical protein